MRADWLTQRGVTRVMLWCVLTAACPTALFAYARFHSLLWAAAVIAEAGIVVPASLLVRARPPFHHCAPRHARRAYTGTDTDTRLKLADIQRRLDSYDRAWTLAGMLRRGSGQHKRDLRLIQGGDEDDSPEDGNSEAGLTCPASLVIVR